MPRKRNHAKETQPLPLLVFNVEIFHINDPGVTSKLRIGYISAQAFMLTVSLGLLIIIWRKNDQTVVRYYGGNVTHLEPLKPKEIPRYSYFTISVFHHDFSRALQLILGIFSGMFFMAIWHLYFRLNQPMFIEFVLTPKLLLYDTELVAIHILGKSATGELERPFQNNGYFGILTLGMFEKHFERDE